MRAINYSTARQNFAKTIDAVCENNEPVIITKKGEGAVVMISIEDYSALTETDYLLSSPVNASHLARGIKEHREGKTKKFSLMQLKEKINEN